MAITNSDTIYPWRMYPSQRDNSSAENTARLFAKMVSAMCQENVEVHYQRDHMSMDGGRYMIEFKRTGFRMMLSDLHEMRDHGRLEMIAEDTAKRYIKEFQGRVDKDMDVIRGDVYKRPDPCGYDRPVGAAVDRVKVNNHANDAMRYLVDNVKMSAGPIESSVKRDAGKDLERELQAKIDKWLKK